MTNVQRFRPGVKIKLSENVSPNGRYCEYAGMKGKVVSNLDTWDNSISEILFENGDTLRNVGYSIVSIYDEPIEKGSVLKSMEKELNKLKLSQKVLESKIKFMKETGAEKFDKVQFAIYNTLQTIPDDLSTIEKAKMLAQEIGKS